jgi:uncharacterized protein involved in exopolysaccharide biosynthesis
MSKHLAEERLFLAREALAHASSPPADGDSGTMPLRKLLASAFRWRRLVAGCVALGATVGAFLAVTTPNTYVSEGTFLFSATGSESINVDLTRSDETKAEAIAANAVHVLQAESLLRRVVARVTPAEILVRYHPEDQGATGLAALLHAIQRDWNAVDVGEVSAEEALKVLRKRLVVDRSRLSEVIVASYTANDWRLAQKVLAVYMEEAKKWHQEQYDDPKVHAEVRKRADDAVTSRESATRALRDFVEKQAQVQSTFEFELERQRLAEAEAAARLRDNQLAVECAQRQVAELEKRLQTLPPTITVRRRLDSSRAVEVFQEEIAKLETERARAQVESAQEKPTEVALLDQRIARLRAGLQKTLEAQRSAPEVDLETSNPEYTAATELLGRLRNELSGHRAVAGQLQKHRADAGSRLRRLLDLEPQYVALRDALSRADDDMRRSADALAKAELKRQLQLGNFSSLKVLDDASLPLEKEGPDRLKLILGGLVIGLFVGLGLVVLRTVPDRTVRTPGDLEALDGITVVGVLPALDGRNLKRHLATRARGW